MLSSSFLQRTSSYNLRAHKKDYLYAGLWFLVNTMYVECVINHKYYYKYATKKAYLHRPCCSPCAVLSTCALNYSTCTYQILFETHVFVFILCRNIKEYYAIILCISIICFYIIPQLQVFIFRIHNRARCS
jgi:hypothetical protein